MKHICLFGPPGCGKSTTAYGLANIMKKKNINAEYCSEFAKELVYGQDFMKLSNQLSILAKQAYPWFLYEQQGLEYSINDGPFLLSNIYLREDTHLPKEIFKQFVLEMYKSYDTINYFLEPDFSHYQEQGRYQSKEESDALSRAIKQYLIDNDIPFKIIKCGENTELEILKDLGYNE